jgi:hypothetical protein
MTRDGHLELRNTRLENRDTLGAQITISGSSAHAINPAEVHTNQPAPNTVVVAAAQINATTKHATARMRRIRGQPIAIRDGAGSVLTP